MPLRVTARHVNVHRRLAVRRVTRAMSAPASGVQALLWVGSAGLSLMSHVMATWLAIYIPPPNHPSAANDLMVATRFLYPLMQPALRPQQEHISYIGLLGTQALAESGPRRAASATAEPSVDAAAEVAVNSPVEAPPTNPDGVFSEIEVDQTAARDPNSEGPIYPDSLLKREVEGEARVRFVVDSTGHADPQTFGVIEAKVQGFAEAVRQALPRMRFRPASIGEKRVSQSVEQTFVFKISHPAAIP